MNHRRLKVRTRHCLETSGSDYLFTERHIPEEEILSYTTAKILNLLFFYVSILCGYQWKL